MKTKVSKVNAGLAKFQDETDATQHYEVETPGNKCAPKNRKRQKTGTESDSTKQVPFQ